MTDKPTVRVVYLGTTTLADKKPGELWTTEALALAAKDTAELLGTSSAFSKRRNAYTVGAVYESTGSVLNDDGRLVELNRSQLSYRAMVDTDVMHAIVLRAKGEAAQERAKRAEEKARKDGGPALDSLLDQAARIVARAPFQDQARIATGFSMEVQRRALEIWRKGGRG